MNSCLDFFVPMTYTMWMGNGSGPYKSGFDTPVNLPTQFSGYTGYSLSNPATGGPLTYLTAGYTPSKVAISISFEGSRFSGVTTMGQAYSGWGFCSTVTKCLGSGYAGIPASGRQYDATAQAAYCVSGSTVYSYQSVQSVTQIATWARQNGFGAIMIYDLGPGYEATSGTADPWALLHAIWTIAASGTVTPPVNPPVLATFTSSPASLPAGGGTVTLTWTSTNAASVAISGFSGIFSTSGSTTVSVTSSTSWTATATGPGGTSSKTASVTVAVAPPPPVTYDSAATFQAGLTAGYALGFPAGASSVHKPDSALGYSLGMAAGKVIGAASVVCPDSAKGYALGLAAGTAGGAASVGVDSLWIYLSSGKKVKK